MNIILKVFSKILVLICMNSNAFPDATFLRSAQFHEARQLTGHTWNTDGTILHISSSQAQGNGVNTSAIDKVYRYELSTGFDLSTITGSSTSLNIRVKTLCGPGANASHGGFQQPEGLTFNNDGTRLFIANKLQRGGSSHLAVCQLDVDTAFNAPAGVTAMDPKGIQIDNGGTPDVGDNSAQSASGIVFNDNGSKLFLTNQNTNTIYEFDLSTNFLASTATYNNASFHPTENSFDVINGIAFNNDGTRMYVVERNLDDIHQYTLSSAYDLDSTITYEGTFDGSSTEGIRTKYRSEGVSNSSGAGVATHISFNDDGTKFFVSTGKHVNSSNRQFILEYSLNVPYQVIDIAPILTSSSPTDDATGIEVDGNITLTFSEAVDAESSGNNLIKIKKCSDDSTVESIDVTGDKVSGSGSNTITINPSVTLDQGTCYYLNIESDAFDDASSKDFTGISDSTTLNFTTEGTTASSNPNPLLNKDVVALIEAQTQAPKDLVQHITTPIFNRLYWLKEHQKGNDLLAQNLKFKFSNPTVDKISKTILASSQKDEDLDDANGDIEKWLFWSEGNISVGRVGDTSLSSSKEVKGDGVTFGIDKLLNNDSTIGYALRFNKDDVDVGDLGTSLDTNAKSFSIYGNVPLDYNKFFETIIGFNTLSLEIIRVNGSNKLTGKRSGKQIYGSIRYVGINEQENFNFSPNIKLDFSETSLSEYSEIGSSPLTYQKQNVQTANVYSGFIISNKIKKNNFTLRPNAGIEFGIDLSPSSDAKLNYVSDPNTVYVKSIDKKNETLNTSLGLDITSHNGLSILLLYKRNQNNNAYSDTIYIGAGYVPSLHAKYTMSLDERMAKLQYDKKLENKVISLNTKYDLSRTEPNHEINLKLSSNF